MGLLSGFGLGMILLWTHVQSTRITFKVSLLLHVSWIIMFGWYWFGRFPISEVGELKSASMGAFLLWVALYSVGPLLKFRQEGEPGGCRRRPRSRSGDSLRNH